MPVGFPILLTVFLCTTHTKTQVSLANLASADSVIETLYITGNEHIHKAFSLFGRSESSIVIKHRVVVYHICDVPLRG
jgi:hypothetical protein